jgi:hypothetical protein
LISAKQWIKALDLRRHPEGGYYREVYRAGETIPRAALPGRFGGDRAFATAIYFLLEGEDCSHLHRIKQDEVWHFFEGSALTLHMIDPAGAYSTTELGRDVQAGHSLMAVVPAGWWFGATVNDAPSFSLVGCTVAPGFDFADLELPDRSLLLKQHPQHRKLIERLMRQPGAPEEC